LIDMRPAALIVTAVAAATLVIGAAARASPPDAGGPQADGETEPTSVWLSLELLGPRGGQIDAARAQQQPPIVAALPRGGAPPPGELVGRVDSLDEALRWVEQLTFAGGPRSSDAPPVGGALLDDHGVHLTALVVTGAGPSGGTTSMSWPPAAELATPESWRPASLAVARAPMFAAPSSTLPPASERYRVVEIGDSLWQLGAFDRCSPTGECLRWAQVLVRRGDRLFGGYLPATQVIADREWVAGPEQRRFALIASHRSAARVHYALIEHRGERREPPRELSHAHAAPAWPPAGVQLIGERLLVLIAGDVELTLEFELEPELDPFTSDRDALE
jgi:hypothetical protein